MWLKKITLNNFRCFEHLEIDLDLQLTVIIGENGAGKTAVLDGIATALSPIFNYLSSSNQRLTGRGFKDTDFRIESWKGRGGKERWGSADYVQVIAEARNLVENQLVEVKWDNWKPSVAGKTPSEKYGDAALKTQLQLITDSYKTNDPLCPPVFAYYGARRGYIEVPDRLHDSKTNYGTPSSALVDALDPMSNFKEMLKWFDIEESAELRANKGVTAEHYLESPVLAVVRVAISIFLGGEFGSPQFNQDHKFGLVRKSDGAFVRVEQLSQGYQSMLALAMDFVRRMALANQHVYEYALQLNAQNIADGVCTSREIAEQYKQLILHMPAIMLVDEIDLHLHPSWQQRVLADLMRVFPLTQFIVTTHSPHVLSTVKRENIRIIGSDVNDKIIAEQPLAMTYGESSADVLHSVMMVNPLPPVGEKGDLDRLTELVDQGSYRTPEAKELMEKLVKVLGSEHSQLLRLQRSIYRQEELGRR